MDLKQMVKKINSVEHEDNNFKMTLLSAKRSINRPNEDWVIVKFTNHHNWRDFTPGMVTLYEALPKDYPTTSMAERLGLYGMEECNTKELTVVSRYSGLTHKWKDIEWPTPISNF
jgi:hypothetical protein